jgi:hypothetical protein
MRAFSRACRQPSVEPKAEAAVSGQGRVRVPRPGGLSGRPRCLIYPLDDGWALRLEKTSAWLLGLSWTGPAQVFPSLSAAIHFAEAKGFEYRVIVERLPPARQRRPMVGVRRSVIQTKLNLEKLRPCPELLLERKSLSSKAPCLRIGSSSRP